MNYETKIREINYTGTKHTYCKGKSTNIIELFEIRTPLIFTYSEKKNPTYLKKK